MATLERAFPSAETVPLRRVVRRTTIIRIALALALVGALALAFLAARDSDVRHAPLVPSGTTGVVVLDLSASVYEAAFGSTLQKMARQGERAGLVVFSDSAYEVLPPGTPGRELLPSSASSAPTRTAPPAASRPTRGRTSAPARASPRVSPRRTRLLSTPARRRARSSSSPTWRSCPTRWRGSAPSSPPFAGTASRFASSRSTPVPRSGYSWRRSSAKARS